MKEDIGNRKSQEEWKEKAINNTRECLKSFISSRVEIALEKISRNQEYQEIKQQYEEREEEVDKILEKLDKEERLFIQRHYENQTTINGYELDETYKQGLKDGIWFLLWMNILQVKDWM